MNDKEYNTILVQKMISEAHWEGIIILKVMKFKAEFFLSFHKT